MSMILYSGHGQRCHAMRFGIGSWAAMALVFGALIPAAAYYAGTRAADPASPPATLISTGISTGISDNSGTLSLTEQEIEQRVQQRLDQHLTGMAPRLARLQAESARLDAIANRLLKVSGEDPEEFKRGSGGPETADARNYTALEFDSALTELSDSFLSETALFDRIDKLLAAYRLESEITPSGWPIDGGWVSSPYGERSDPINGKHAFHHGVDIAAKRYTPIHSVAAGIVSFSGRRTGYGRVVEITHGNGYTTLYGHNQANKVKVGDRVKKGQTIALVGSSGRATGPHVHFEVRSNGTRINPSQFLRASR